MAATGSEKTRGPGNLWEQFLILLEMVKIEHTVFALPFAFMGALLAARGLPSGRQAFFILLAMVGPGVRLWPLTAWWTSPMTP